VGVIIKIAKKAKRQNQKKTDIAKAFLKNTFAHIVFNPDIMKKLLKFKKIKQNFN
jgi:hypothetical protein